MEPSGRSVKAAGRSVEPVQRSVESDEPRPTDRDLYAKWAIPAAIVLTVAAVLRVVRTGIPDVEFLYFILAAMVVLLGESITEFAFQGLSFKRVRILEQRVAELADVATDTSAGFVPPQPSPPDPSAAVPQQPRPTPAPGLLAVTAAAETEAPEPTPPRALTLDERAAELSARIYALPLSWTDDPVTRLTETGDAEVRLNARVRTSRNYPDKMFRITIEIQLGPDARAVGDAIVVFLHQSFPSRVRKLPVTSSVLTLTLLSVGSFTFGVLLADGTTRKLDLVDADLSALDPDQQFRFRTT